MKRLVIGLALAFMPVEAFAIVRYMVQGMTCAEVQASVERDGVAILYQKAGNAGVPLYDRYVANQSYCQGGQSTIRESVPTADTKGCRVSKCIDDTRFGSTNR